MRYVLCLLLMLSACAASGPKFIETDRSVLTASPHSSKIVVYRTDQTWFGNGTYWVEIDGQQVCYLHNASFLVHEVDPGKHLIQSSAFGDVGTSTLTVSPKAGETIYVQMLQNTGHGIISLLGGALAQATSDSGPVTLTKVSKQGALTEIRSFNYESGCH